MNASLVLHATTVYTVRPMLFILSVEGRGKGKGKAIPVQAWTVSEGSRRLRLPNLWQSAHEEGYQSYAPAAFTPQEIFLVPISVSGWVDRRPTVHPEGLCQWKVTMTPSGIEAMTVQFVALTSWLYLH